jgi:hypothetical protein
MADTGYKFPTGDSASTGTWTNATNVQANDSAVAVCKISTKSISSFRVQTNYGFTTSVIPDGSTINTVNLQVKWRVTTTGGIGILACAPLVSGVKITTLSNSGEPTSLSTQTFDITAARAWVPSDFRNGTLTTQLQPWNGNNATDPGYEFDYIALDVIYTPPVTPRTLMVACNLDGCGSDGIFVGNAVD